MAPSRGAPPTIPFTRALGRASAVLPAAAEAEAEAEAEGGGDALAALFASPPQSHRRAPGNYAHYGSTLSHTSLSRG